ncbi:MAG TPA: DedA family protein [Acidimicrobiales bacterium]
MANEDLGGLAGWVVDVIERIGAPGVGALVALETAFPPIPSEVILPFAGFSASQGDVNVVAAWLFATLGALVGAWVLYGIGAMVGYDRLYWLAGKRWFPLFSAADLARGDKFMDRFGDQVILFGRCIPLVRSIVSVPAGLERMPLIRFTALTALGSGVWNAIFIGAGYQLGNRWEQVESWIKPLSYMVVAALALALLWLVYRKVQSVRH